MFIHKRNLLMTISYYIASQSQISDNTMTNDNNYDNSLHPDVDAHVSPPIIHPAPSSSTCVLSFPDMHEGITYLEKVLLCAYEMGIHASPFQLNVKHSHERLRQLLSMHGICSQNLSLEDCRIILFRHLFSGCCVATQCASADRTACLLFSNGFQSAQHM